MSGMSGIDTEHGSCRASLSTVFSGFATGADVQWAVSRGSAPFEGVEAVAEFPTVDGPLPIGASHEDWFVVVHTGCEAFFDSVFTPATAKAPLASAGFTSVFDRFLCVTRAGCNGRGGKGVGAR